MSKTRCTQTASLDLTVPPSRPDYRPAEPPSLDGISVVSLDFETDGLDWRGRNRPIGLAVGWSAGGKIEKRYLPFRHTGGNLDEEVVKRWANTELRGKTIVGAHIKFDAHHSRVWGCDLEDKGNELEDVLHNHAILNDHTTVYSLEDISQQQLGVGKVKGVDVKNLIRYHACDVAPYAERDVELPLRLRAKQHFEMTQQDLHRIRQLENDCIWPVIEMEKNGAIIDEEKLRQWNILTEQNVNRNLYEIKKLAGFPVDIGKKDDLVRLFNARGLYIHTTPTGKPSFTDEIFKATSFDPAVELIRKTRKLQSLRDKYITSYLEDMRNGILSFNLHQLRGDYGEGQAGTITGRFSATDKNIQQVPDEEKQLANIGAEYIIRELFGAGFGSKVLAGDAAQVEFRIFAGLARSKFLDDAYERDPTTSFHMVVWDLIKKINEQMPYKGVKNTNFCKLYGGGIEKIALMIGCDFTTAEAFVQDYDSAFPEVNELLREASNLAQRRGYVKTLMGRRARFEMGCKCPACATRGPRFYKALNGVVQGTAADIMKQKLIELHKERKRTGFVMRMTVHDEVVGDTPSVECTRMVTEILNRQTSGVRKIPILWEVGTGPNWGKLEKFKEAA